MSAVHTICAEEAAALIPDGAIVTISSASGLGCPDAVLAAIGKRFDDENHPQAITTIHPIAAGDMYGIKGIDHIAKPGLLAKVIAGSYPSGPSSMTPPAIWQMIGNNEVAAWNLPSGILFDMHREAAAHRPGVLTQTGMDTFVDPLLQGGAMNEKAASQPFVKRVEFADDNWLFFPAIAPQVAIIRATTADERGNLSYEHEGAYLGPMEQALATRNSGGIVIAQVKRQVAAGSLNPKSVRIPGVLVDYVVVAPEQMQTTQTVYEPAISGEIVRPLQSFSLMEQGPARIIAQRVTDALSKGDAVNIGFGISANVPRILLEQERHGDVTWLLEHGAVGGVPLLDFQFGCASNAEAFMPSPQQFTYFQGGGFDLSLMSFLQIGSDGSVNVSQLPSRPHVTAGCGGFIDITSSAKRIIFSGFFNAGAQLALEDGRLRILKEGKAKKLVQEVAHVTFSGKRAMALGQQVLYVTERCVIELTERGLVVTEVAPGIDPERDILAQSDAVLHLSDNLKLMHESYFSQGEHHE
ncbi:Acetate CoA-transferase subunit alpha [Leminorella richardii]|uniref:Acetate CoA-transferase YdiF n=1 Tax=Leminorella richardii TaxID=158841 RepID=A0A2X4X362_9GAMM|nr:CoA-transferase [Leminorella richardii]SQI33825.1 Acetate CoA-transferase subunit alpha [Leminorella richardii]